jgi:hypothetical protein
MTRGTFRSADVAEADIWRDILASWRSMLGEFWRMRDRKEAVWAWSERTNVGLLASAFERADPARHTMAEVPVRGTSRGDKKRLGRFDLWLGSPSWECHLEAKLQWVHALGGDDFEGVNARLLEAEEQCGRLLTQGWVKRVAVVTFVVPSVLSSTRCETPAQVHEAYGAYAERLWLGRGRKKGAFQDTFSVPVDELAELTELHTGRGRYYPGVIVHGRVLQ